MAFATEHSSALADIRAAGANVTFTSTTETYVPSTDTTTAGATTTVTGAAMRVKSAPVQYIKGTLIEQAFTTLLFAPDTYGDRPPLGSTVTWESTTFTVVDVSPLAPDGTDIISRVVIV